MMRRSRILWLLVASYAVCATTGANISNHRLTTTVSQGGSVNGPSWNQRRRQPRRWDVEDDQDLAHLCSFSKWIGFGETSEEERRLKDAKMKFGTRPKQERFPTSSATGRSQQPRQNVQNKVVPSQQRMTTPVIYRFFPRSRSRHNSDSVPFVIFGPNVDHWDEVGEALASRGFNVVVCERIPESDSEKKKKSKKSPTDNGEDVVLGVMDAFNMDVAVLVACDDEASFAIETAMHLAPDRIGALILCGDLADTNKLAKEAGFASVDSLLGRVLECPFNIIWDASHKKGSGPNPGEMSERTVILGGGTAPHRLRPEHLAWVLSRFVEENIGSDDDDDDTNKFGMNRIRSDNSERVNFWPKISFTPRIPFGFGTLVSDTTGRLVMGRAIAAVFFYVTVIKVAVVQYSILKAGIHSIKSKYDTVDALLKRVFQATISFIVGIPRLFSVKRAREDDDDIDDINEIDLLAPADSQASENSRMDEYDQPPRSHSQSVESSDDDDEVEDDSEEGFNDYQEYQDKNDIPGNQKPFVLLDHLVT